MHVHATLLTTVSNRHQLAAPFRAMPSVLKETERRDECSGDGLRFARGFLYAVGMEAAAALCLFAVWLGWHLVRQAL
jgi:hypothetical protein